MKLPSICLFLLLCSISSQSLGQENATVDMGGIRDSSDGSGPSHLFWLSEVEASKNGTSVIGVIDPLLSAIRFFYVDHLVTTQSLHSRFSKAGVCALPIDFRPWQIHQTDDIVFIESMPKPSSEGYRTAKKNFTSRVYRIDRKILSESRDLARSSQERIDQPGWNPQSELQCGTILTASDGSADGTVGRASPFKAARGKNHPQRTIILTNDKSALAPSGQLIVRAAKGNWLYNARELEPAGETRIVQIAEGVPSRDGVLRVRQSILAYRNTSIKSELMFDETLLRSKLGFKPIAVMPSGEILAMGMVDDVFRIQSCGLLHENFAHAKGSFACVRSGIVNASREIPDTSPITSDNDKRGIEENNDIRNLRQLTTHRVFNNIEKIATTQWSVDTQSLPEECRSISGCIRPGGRYVPLRGVRLTRGVYKKEGLPYAMTDHPNLDVVRLLNSISFNSGNLTDAFSTVSKVPTDIPGNLDDDFTNDIGIDCSALLQFAWGAGGSQNRTSTGDIQRRPPGYICKNRVPAIEFLRAGDAISINISATSETATGLIHKGANHVVLYASTVKFDNANDSWLVQESSSSCDGVCWSVFDPSFFNGWGLYRADGQRDNSCPVDNGQNSIKDHAIPTEFSKWRNKIINSIGP